MIDEGYTKYRVDWREGPPPAAAAIAALNACRNRLFDAGLVGHDAVHDVGYGNLSVRAADGTFVITGTQTGHIARIDETHYATVTAYDIDANHVRCVGPVQASSEALTHAAIYELDAAIRAIAHVHSAALWQRLLNRIPTTSADVPYGTPEMAREFQRLYRETDLPDAGVAAMAGHQDGIVAFGSDIRAAGGRLLALLEEVGGPQ
jgi:ribulose-5-phosphate 4-epimerase/fuculose-1-phosphate aldolase